MDINRVSYQILEESISLYISINDKKEEDIIIRIIGDIKDNTTNLKEYLNLSDKEELNYYRTFILLKPTIKNKNLYIEPEEIEKQLLEQASVKFNKVLDHLMEIPIIDSSTPFVNNSYTDFDSNELIVLYDGILITSKKDLITYIVNMLLDKKIDILKEDYRNNEDENQLCLKF